MKISIYCFVKTLGKRVHSRQYFQSLGSLANSHSIWPTTSSLNYLYMYGLYTRIRRFIGLSLKNKMDKFVVRTKRLPKPGRESAVTKDNKKQATIESLAVRFLTYLSLAYRDICSKLYIKLKSTNGIYDHINKLTVKLKLKFTKSVLFCLFSTSTVTIHDTQQKNYLIPTVY